MGGRGSGRNWCCTKATVDASKRLDARYLKKHGLLRTGSYDMSWTRNGEACGNAMMHIIAGKSMRVVCSWRRNSSEAWKPMERTVQIERTPCNFGGSRSWFICPCCHRRVAVVLLQDDTVACRHCLNLTYASCNEDKIDRSIRRKDKYAEKLGGAMNVFGKPDRMHWKTWERLQQKYFEEERLAEMLIAAKFGYT